MPRDRKHNHSEYRKAALYLMVLKPTFPAYLAVIILTTVFFFDIVYKSYATLSRRTPWNNRHNYNSKRALGCLIDWNNIFVTALFCISLFL